MLTDGFDISLAHRHDHLVAVCIRLSPNLVATTREIVASTLPRRL